MRLTFLGTGTSFGVPVIGCDCETCTSSDPRDRRSRHAALLESDGGTLRVDTPPELRLQLVDAGVKRIDAVWYTHAHADHVHGVDDLRAFSARSGGIRVLASAETARLLLDRFRYVFDEMLACGREQAVLRGLASPGDRVVVTAGYPMHVAGTTNLLQVEEV